MIQKTTRNFLLRIILFNLFVSMFIGSVRAETVITAESPVDEVSFHLQKDTDSAITPRDITYNEGIWSILKSSSTVYYAPYATGNAPTEYTLAAGSGVYVRGRVYDYYYVYWYINGKEMYGYIPISKLDVTGYVWINYDLYQKASCTATTPVLSGPGTTNTYFSYGEIYAGESPLMVLGQVVNKFNHKTYFYIQYELSNGLIKRGWVEAGLQTVHLIVGTTSNLFNEINCFSFINTTTHTALTWNQTSNTITHQTFTGALNQLFYIDIQTDTNGNNTYYSKIVPVLDRYSAIRVASTGYASGLSLTTSSIYSVDKRQEFYLATSVAQMGSISVSTVGFYTRSTGFNKALSAQANGAVKQVAGDSSSNIRWELVCISGEWAGTFGQRGGSQNPSDFYVYYDSTVNEYFSSNGLKQLPLAKWNNAYDPLSLSYSNSFNLDDTNRLSHIAAGTLENTKDCFVLGQCQPIIYTNGQYYYTSDVNKNQITWHSTRIVLDISKMESRGFQAGDIRNVLVHELGHALKLSHTFLHFVWESDTVGEWTDFDLSNNVMNPTISATPPGETVNSLTPGELDGWRLAQKWDNVI